MIPQLLWLALLFQPSPDPLLAAIRQVESGNQLWVIGDGGESVGCYQIGRAYWQDGCEYAGVNWPYAWALLPPRALGSFFWRRN